MWATVANFNMAKSFKSEELRVTADSISGLPERTLWTNVLKDAASAIRQKNDRHAIEFFLGQHFELLCFYLKLDASSIRNKVVSPSFRTTSQPRVYKSAGKRSVS